MVENDEEFSEAVIKGSGDGFYRHSATELLTNGSVHCTLSMGAPACCQHVSHVHPTVLQQ